MILIIAYGNSLRQDDGAGLVLAEMLEAACRARRLEVERIVTHQLTPELSLEVARQGVAAVVFVDTRAVDPAETTPFVEVRPISTASLSPSLGHHLNPACLLVYAHLLYGQHPPAWEVTVPGVDFEHGEDLSPIARQVLAAGQGLLSELAGQLAVQRAPLTSSPAPAWG